MLLFCVGGSESSQHDIMLQRCHILFPPWLFSPPLPHLRHSSTALIVALPELSFGALRGGPGAGGGRGWVEAGGVPLASKTFSGSLNLEKRGQRIALAVRHGELAGASWGGVDRPCAPVLHPLT